MGRLPLRTVTVPRQVRVTVRATPAAARYEADAEAEALFESLLDPAQLAQWQRTRRCWVATPRGPVRLGVQHDLRFRPDDDPGNEWSLCVVPTGRTLPVADVWSNLLLVLGGRPRAVLRGGQRGDSRPPPYATASPGRRTTATRSTTSTPAHR